MRWLGSFLALSVWVVVWSVYFSLLLPFFYGIPKALCWWMRGLIRVSAVVALIIGPLTATLVFAGFDIFLLWALPSSLIDLVLGWPFQAGKWLGLVYTIFYVLSQQGRASLRTDFMWHIGRYVRKNVGPSDAVWMEFEERNRIMLVTPELIAGAANSTSAGKT